MSFFISSIPAAGLMSRPPESKQTPLPTSVTFGAAGSPHWKSIKSRCRRRGLPHRVDRRKALAQRIALDDATLRTVVLGQRHRLGRQALRRQVGGRRIDQVARHRRARQRCAARRPCPRAAAGPAWPPAPGAACCDNVRSDSCRKPSRGPPPSQPAQRAAFRCAMRRPATDRPRRRDARTRARRASRAHPGRARLRALHRGRRPGRRPGGARP